MNVLIQRGLSNREAELVLLVSKGLNNAEIANQMFMTEQAVKFVLRAVYRIMRCKSRAQLIVWCLPHLGYCEGA